MPVRMALGVGSAACCCSAQSRLLHCPPCRVQISLTDSELGPDGSYLDPLGTQKVRRRPRAPLAVLKEAASQLATRCKPGRAQQGWARDGG